MSEYGSQLELEQEIALKEAQLISKVVTKPVASCCESARATFKVNKYKPLFSAMSRVSPSPDWNVGVDSLDLCDHKKCSWRKKIELDLDPWDAGTDSGITFTSPNHESRPSEQIHYIGKRKDLHSESSLNLGGNKAPSLAKIILHLVKIDGKCSGHLNEVNIPKVGRAPGTCHVSIWTSWTRCSVSCGFGTRVRGRLVSGEVAMTAKSQNGEPGQNAALLVGKESKCQAEEEKLVPNFSEEKGASYVLAECPNDHSINIDEMHNRGYIMSGFKKFS
eukprot:gene5004-109_t